MLKVYSGWWNKRPQENNIEEAPDVSQEYDEMIQQQKNTNDATQRLQNVNYQTPLPQQQSDELSPEILRRLQELGGK